MRYLLLRCPPCDYVWLHDSQQTAGVNEVRCARCGRAGPTDDFAIIAESDSPSELASDRAEILADERESHGRDQITEFGNEAEASAGFSYSSSNKPGQHNSTCSREPVEREGREPEDSDVGGGSTEERDRKEGTSITVPVTDDVSVKAEPDTGAYDVRFRELGGTVTRDGVYAETISPKASEWLPDLQQALLPQAAGTVQALYEEYKSGKAAGGITSFQFWLNRRCGAGTGDASSRAAAVRLYFHALAKYSLQWADPKYRHLRENSKQQVQDLRQQLKTIGTGKGPWNSSVEAIEQSIVPLFAYRDRDLPIIFYLDGSQWMDADNRTIAHALRTLAILSKSFTVVLSLSPRVRAKIRRIINHRRDMNTPSDWLAGYANLTEPDTSSQRSSEGAAEKTDTDEASAKEAEQFVVDHAQETGLLKTLAALDQTAPTPVRELKLDDDIDYAEGSIDKYVATLEGAGLITIDRSFKSNRVELTELGTAAQEYVAPDGTAVGASQTTLTEFGESDSVFSAARKCSVPSSPEQEGVRWTAPERWVAQTGDPTAEAQYIQWLGDPGGDRVVQPDALHRRYLVGERVNGINLVDDDILCWQDPGIEGGATDGRVTYISEFDDTVLALCQWGGAIPTLARLTGALFSPKAIARCFDSAVSGDLRSLHGTTAYGYAITAVLQQCQQIGWLSTDEVEDYSQWRKRILEVRGNILARVGDYKTAEPEERTNLLRDLQGLFCSAVHLYRAAGYDISVNIRVPRPDELQQNTGAYDDFLGFFKHTAPKQMAYDGPDGLHSCWRLMFEDRPEKLKARRACTVQPGDEYAESLVTWSVVGPGVSEFKNDLIDACAAQHKQLREQVANGDEQAPTVSLPIETANSRSHRRAIIKEVAERKGFTDTSRHAIDRLERVLNSVFSTAEYSASPYRVHDVLDGLARKTDDWHTLTVDSIAARLAELPPQALYPTLPPAAREMLHTMLAAETPVSRNELEEVTSKSSVYRYLDTLQGLYLVEESDDGLQATIEPWWTPEYGSPHPRHEADPRLPGARETQAVFHATDVLALAYDSCRLSLTPAEYAQLGPDDPRETFKTVGCRGWYPIVAALLPENRWLREYERNNAGARTAAPFRDSGTRVVYGAANEQQQLPAD